MCKPRHHATAITVRVNRLKLKIKQLRATRDELIAIANRLVELQEDLIAEKSKMEKVKDEALGRLEAELNEAKCRLSESQLRHQELMDQKDVLDSLPLESETTPYSGEAHLESTPDSNCDVTPHNSFDDKTIICGKLETITQGSEEACVHPPPRHGGRMPSPSVMLIRAQLNLPRNVIETDVHEPDAQICVENTEQHTTKVEAPKVTSLIQTEDVKADIVTYDGTSCMSKPRHHATAITVRVNRLKLKIKQLRATRDELIAIANRLVELQEDLIAEKSKMEKVKDEALGRLEAELNEAKCRLSESQLRHQELMDQKDVLDSLPLESETTPYSGEAHLESTPDSNCDVTPHNSFDDKTIICGKLETITQGYVI
ncbi:unnamed protein product [Aphanomyces euteiches]